MVKRVVILLDDEQLSELFRRLLPEREMPPAFNAQLREEVYRELAALWGIGGREDGDPEDESEGEG